MSYATESSQASRIRELEAELAAEKQRLDTLERLLYNGQVELWISHTQRFHILGFDNQSHPYSMSGHHLRSVLDAVKSAAQ